MQELIKDLDYKCYIIADLAKDGIIAAGQDKEIIHIFNRILAELGETIYNPYNLQEEELPIEHIISISNLKKEIKNAYDFEIDICKALGFYKENIFIHNIGKYSGLSEEQIWNVNHIDGVLKTIFGEEVKQVTIIKE